MIYNFRELGIKHGTCQASTLFLESDPVSISIRPHRFLSMFRVPRAHVVHSRSKKKKNGTYFFGKCNTNLMQTQRTRKGKKCNPKVKKRNMIVHDTVTLMLASFCSIYRMIVLSSHTCCTCVCVCVISWGASHTIIMPPVFRPQAWQRGYTHVFMDV